MSELPVSREYFSQPVPDNDPPLFETIKSAVEPDQLTWLQLPDGLRGFKRIPPELQFSATMTATQLKSGWLTCDHVAAGLMHAGPLAGSISWTVYGNRFVPEHHLTALAPLMLCAGMTDGVVLYTKEWVTNREGLPEGRPIQPHTALHLIPAMYREVSC